MGNSRRVIEINDHIVGPRPPRLRTRLAAKPSDYARVPVAYRDVAQRLSSPLMLGPPICDELIALVQHLFTEEEAGVVRHLGLFSGRTAAQLARDEHRPIEQIHVILDRLMNENIAIVSSGGGKTSGIAHQSHLSPSCRYRLLPIVPGIFEMLLVNHTPDSLTEWHRRFIELFEALYETGFSLDYRYHRTPIVRYLPIGTSIEAHPMALPSDQLEVVLDQFKVFAVGQCQCRLTMESLGQGCGKPLGNCMLMGQWAKMGIENSTLRQVSKHEALEIKREAESHGLVSWMMNVNSNHSQSSCSCCGCCCHAMRTINEFNAPGFIAPPHFFPRLDSSKCTYCGKCAKSCPMGALVVDTQRKTYRHLPKRCIGCGLCVLACKVSKAIVMEPVPKYRMPYRSWFSLIAQAAPGVLVNSWKLARQRGR